MGKTIQEQKDITIEFEEELVRLEKQLKETGKASFSPQKASLKKQIDSIKDSIKDQRVSLKNLNNERSKARSLMSNVTDGIKRQSIVVRTLSHSTTACGNVAPLGIPLIALPDCPSGISVCSLKK